MLLRTEFIDHRWVTSSAEPSLLAPPPLKPFWPQPSLPAPFAAHDIFELPDSPPVDGARSSRVHRFVLNTETASAINSRLTHEAQRQAWGLPRLSGESKSNVGGYHSQETCFHAKCDGEWYRSLLLEVLHPALRCLDGEGSGGSEAVDVNGVPLQGRISGWLNVSGPHAFNALHRHGTDVAWSAVYFVQSGEEEEASSDGGQLLLRATTQDSDGGASSSHGYFPISPVAGELWLFPGYMAHAVMPRELKNAKRPIVTGQQSNGGGADNLLAPIATALDQLLSVTGVRGFARRPRISVACNIYLLSSFYRDERIGYYKQQSSSSASKKPRECVCGPVAPWGGVEDEENLAQPPAEETEAEVLKRRREILARARRRLAEGDELT